MEMSRQIALSLTALLLAGCVWDLDEESLARGPLGRIVDDCVVPPPPGVAQWGAPVAVEYADRSLWIWDEIALADGRRVRNAGALVASAAGACRGDVDLVADGDGVPLPLVSLTAEEEAANAARTDGRRAQLSITGGFVQEERARVYYEKVLVGPGFFDAAVVGMGLCLIDDAGGPCRRATPAAYPEEPTLLWYRSPRVWNRGAFVAADGYAYLWGCLHAAAFEDLCAVARVPPDGAADPAAYRYAGWDGSWIDDAGNAGALLENAGALTPGFNAHLDRYVAVAADIWDPGIALYRADAAAGSYGDPVRLFDAVPPDDWFIGGGVEHSALADEGGRTIAVSYFSGGSGPEHGLHLVRFRFEEEF
jgi:hypothetical protein